MSKDKELKIVDEYLNFKILEMSHIISFLKDKFNNC